MTHLTLQIAFKREKSGKFNVIVTNYIHSIILHVAIVTRMFVRQSVTLEKNVKYIIVRFSLASLFITFQHVLTTFGRFPLFFEVSTVSHYFWTFPIIIFLIFQFKHFPPFSTIPIHTFPFFTPLPDMARRGIAIIAVRGWGWWWRWWG